MYGMVGGWGSESAARRPPPNREIVSFRACVRRTFSGCEEKSRVKTDACGRARPLSLSPRYHFRKWFPEMCVLPVTSFHRYLSQVANRQIGKIGK